MEAEEANAVEMLLARVKGLRVIVTMQALLLLPLFWQSFFNKNRVFNTVTARSLTALDRPGGPTASLNATGGSAFLIVQDYPDVAITILASRDEFWDVPSATLRLTNSSGSSLELHNSELGSGLNIHQSQTLGPDILDFASMGFGVGGAPYFTMRGPVEDSSIAPRTVSMVLSEGPSPLLRLETPDHLWTFPPG